MSTTPDDPVSGWLPELFTHRIDFGDGGHLDMLSGPPAAEGAPSILDLFPDDVAVEGFTGTKVDAAGHKRQWVDGKQVAGHHDDDGPSPARASGADTHDPDTAHLPPDRRNFVGKAVGKLRELGFRGSARAAKDFVVAVEHKLAYAAHKVREIAVEAGKRRKPPMDEDGLKRLSRALFAADFAGGLAVGGALALAGNPLAGKVFSWTMPSASVFYLVYSAATNKAGTWEAAKQVVGDVLRGKSHAHEAAPADLADRLAEVLEREDGDWREAVFLAALGETNDVGRAVEVAKAAPGQPAELPTPTDDDYGVGDDAGD